MVEATARAGRAKWGIRGRLSSGGKRSPKRSSLASAHSVLANRFPPLAKAYDARLRSLARAVASTMPELTLREGVYAMVGGPSFETGAELRFLAGTIGADAVGMSTAPEVIVARHMGMSVLGISLITNAATGAESEDVKTRRF